MKRMQQPDFDQLQRRRIRTKNSGVLRINVFIDCLHWCVLETQEQPGRKRVQLNEKKAQCWS